MSARRTQRPPLKILITAGPTREYVDTVRYISNDSSGKMGFALAAAAARRGHVVTLIHGPVALTPPKDVSTVQVVSAADMWRACRDAWPAHDALIMAAAVADYTPARVLRRKHKKQDADFSIPLRPTRDILASLSRRRRPDQRAIGFALEDRAPRRNAEKKLRDKRLDAIILNRPAAIGADASVVEILTADGWAAPISGDKARVARRIVALLEGLREDS